jgi:hypothetical protein
VQGLLHIKSRLHKKQGFCTKVTAEADFAPKVHPEPKGGKLNQKSLRAVEALHQNLNCMLRFGAVRISAPKVARGWAWPKLHQNSVLH